MNLFILGWNLPREIFPTIMVKLRQMIEIYPQLDPQTIWHLAEGGTAFAASMHTSVEAAAPRNYIWRNNNQVTFFEGSILTWTKGIRANNAAMLARHWDVLPEILEGQFVVVKVVNNPPCIELMTDFLGIEQVYYLQQGNTWLVSNSVRLLAQISKTKAIDPLGASLFLTTGWAGADRTLRCDIRVIPGGQRWKWQWGSVEPSRQIYYPLSRLSRQPQRSLTAPDIKDLAEELVTTCRTLSQDYGELLCPLTSGKDTRVLASLLISSGIRANYYTSGDPDSIDVRIGTRIARTFNLPYQVYIHTTKDVIEEWEAASRRLVQQNDGMVSLWQIADVLQQPSRVDRLSLSLWGIGGEVARGFYAEPKIFLYRNDTQHIQDFLCQRLVRNHGGLIRRDAIALAQTYIRRFVEEVIDQGFDPLDVPDIFYALERVRRWAGSNNRKSRPASDRFSPFCTKAFVKAAFAIPALHRCSEPLHYALIRLLVPELHSLPFGKRPWRSQRPLISIVCMAADKKIQRVRSGISNRIFRQQSAKSNREVGFDRVAWLEAKSSWLRELCLDQSDTLLWDFVDRSLFERVTSKDTNVADRHGCILGLYNAATLFQYALT
jgi:asparagine synthase (glutamine-hydrolysing)